MANLTITNATLEAGGILRFTFSGFKSYTVTVTASSGSVAISQPKAQYSVGDFIYLTAFPPSGYEVADWKVNGVIQTDSYGYTITDQTLTLVVEGNMTIVVDMEVIPGGGGGGGGGQHQVYFITYIDGSTGYLSVADYQGLVATGNDYLIASMTWIP